MDYLRNWKCRVCGKEAQYKARKFFLCRKHWAEYLENPKTYLIKVAKTGRVKQ